MLLQEGQQTLFGVGGGFRLVGNRSGGATYEVYHGIGAAVHETMSGLRVDFHVIVRFESDSRRNDHDQPSLSTDDGEDTQASGTDSYNAQRGRSGASKFS